MSLTKNIWLSRDLYLNLYLIYINLYPNWPIFLCGTMPRSSLLPCPTVWQRNFYCKNETRKHGQKWKIWNCKLEMRKSTQEEICGCCKRNPVSNNDRLLSAQQSFNMLPPHSLASYKKFHFKGAPRIISIYQYYIYIIYIGL